MLLPRIIHHRAVNGVTGSCHELIVDEETGVLIDCGLFQGAETSGQGTAFERLGIEFPVDHIRTLIVTQVHIDHVGRIPYLLAGVLTGPIYCSEPSARLLPQVLEDAIRMGISRRRRFVERLIARIERQILPLPYAVWRSLETGGNRIVDITLKPAGHIPDINKMPQK